MVTREEFDALKKRVTDIEKRIQSQSPEINVLIQRNRLSREGVEEAFEALSHQKSDEGHQQTQVC